jgi:hypothetical protein
MWNEEAPRSVLHLDAAAATIVWERAGGIASS